MAWRCPKCDSDNYRICDGCGRHYELRDDYLGPNGRRDRITIVDRPDNVSARWGGGIMRFRIGDRVKAIALPNGFPRPRPEVTDLVVTRVKTFRPAGMKPYQRVRAESCQQPYKCIEGAAQFFALEEAS